MFLQSQPRDLHNCDYTFQRAAPCGSKVLILSFLDSLQMSTCFTPISLQAAKVTGWNQTSGKLEISSCRNFIVVLIKLFCLSCHHTIVTVCLGLGTEITRL